MEETNKYNVFQKEWTTLNCSPSYITCKFLLKQFLMWRT